MTEESPIKVGQLVLRRYCNAKSVKRRVLKVTKVNKQRYPNYPDYVTYSYDVVDIDGNETKNVGQVTTFDSAREKSNYRMQKLYRSMSKLQAQIAKLNKLEDKAIKEFDKTK